MSHDQDADGLTASHMPRTRKPGPQAHAGRLERPSLFAGMEDDDVDDVDADRVRLLSTLTSRGDGQARGRRAGAGRAGRSSHSRRPGERAASLASPWWSRALFAAMALGAIAVLYSFVQVVRQPHAMSARALAAAHAPMASNATATATAVTAATDLNALDPTAAGAGIDPAHARTAAPASAEAPSAASFQDVAAMASARIEVVAPPVVTPTSPATAPTPGPALAAPAAEAPLASPTSAGPTVQAAHPTHAALVARAAADAARLNAPVPSAAQPTAQPAARPALPRETGARTRANEDVALLEAMMKHASARRAPPSSAEALQACAALQGADAAVCKAKACVQHPTAPQCHGDGP